MKLEKIKEMLSKISPWPWCQDCAESGIRHLIRNCYDSFGCEQTFEKECKRFGKYDGDFISKTPEIIDQLIKQNELMREALIIYSKSSHQIYMGNLAHGKSGFIPDHWETITLAAQTLKEVERIEDEKGCN